jgi:hypothetical protein
VDTFTYDAPWPRHVHVIKTIVRVFPLWKRSVVTQARLSAQGTQVSTWGEG